MVKTAAPISFLSLSSFIVLCGGLALSGCVAAPPPFDEYCLARAAVRAAQDVDGARFSTGLWNKAEDNYRNGQRAFKDADFGRAKDLFISAQQFAEKSENSTRLKKFQTGDSFP